ncbi:MAG: hypothetical protein KIT57_24550 [Blastocatellales bacterium]|nr:hypothetical protein [Blastocatellales bacterium]MCW5971688.1 hypothetical protein [Blastocatellales bacterium]
MVKLLLLASSAIVVVFVGLYWARSNAVLYRFDKAAAKSTGGPSFSIFNPLRDRSPEHAAEGLLEQIKTQGCVQAMTNLPLDQERRQYLYDMEETHRLISWRLANREGASNKIKIFYWIRRHPYNDFNRQLWVTVEKQGEQWKVVDYESWY